MKRILMAALTALMLGLTAAPALAEEGADGPAPDEPTKVEPYYVGVQAIETRLTVEGEPVDIAPAGRRVDVRVVFENQGEETARDAVATLIGSSPGWDVIEGRAELGTLAPGERARGDFAVRIPEDPTRCYNGGGFEGKVASSLDDAYWYAAIKPDCPGPNLYVQELRFNGGDDDGVPEPGERLNVIMIVANGGRDAANDVRGVLRIESPDVRVIVGEAAWPDIAPGGTARNTEPFVIEIDADAERAQGCEQFVTSEPVADGDEPVSSDGGTVSSDGTVTTDPPPPADDQPQSVPGDEGEGGGSAGSSGSADGGEIPAEETTAEEGTIEEGTVEPEKPQDDPLPVEEAPAPGEPGPDERTSEDQPVAFEAMVAVTASGYSGELWAGSGAYCVLESRGVDDERTSGGGDEVAAPAIAARDLAGSAESSGARGGAVAAAVLTMAAAAGALAWRTIGRRQRAASV